MTTSKEKIISIWNFLAANISFTILQVFALGFSGFLYLVIWVISEWSMSRPIGNSLLSLNLPSIIGTAAAALVYGLIWLSIWTILYRDGIKWFYYRVASSIIPMPIFLYWYNLQTGPYEIRPINENYIINSLVTGVILLPIYSVSIYKFILQKNKHKVRNTILVCTANLLIGVMIYALSWNAMFKVGSINLEKENLAGIELMQPAEKEALQKKFGPLTYNLNDGKGKKGATYNARNLASIEVDENNQITAIRGVCLTTSKNIVPGSSLSDVLKAYGNNCFKRSQRDPMGDGGDYIIYVDREHDITLEFYFTVFGSVSRNEVGPLESITLRKGQ